MIQTIVLIQNGKYPFGQVVSSKKAIKVEDIREYNTLQQLRAQRSKMQNLFNSSDKGSQTTIQQNDNINLIRLNKIYQQDLTLHFIYEYVPYSLSQYIRKRFYDEIDLGKSQIFQMNTKLFLKRMSYQLGVIVNFLVKEKIKVNLEFDLLGIDQQQNLKFFIDPNCELMTSDFKGKSFRNLSASMRLIEDELREFYDHKKQEIIEKIQFQFIKIKKKQSHLPNFVIKGNNLIFENQFSEVQSECFSPCPSNMTESSFTDRCESVNSLIKKENDNIRKTHGNLFTKLKKTQSYNYNQQTETHKRLMQNKQKLQNLREKSKKLKQDLKHSYLSNSHCFPSNPADNDNKEFSRRGSTQFHNIFNKRAETQKAGEQDWRNSQIPQNLRKTHLPKGSSGKSPNRFGLKLDGMRSKSNRNHKSSFQFKPNKGKDWFNPNRSFDKGYEDDFDDKSFQQSRSIRIQVQQKTGNKERKNSFKVKILTCQQMQMDGDNVEEFVFNAMNRNFNHNKNDDDRQSSNSSRYAKQSNRSQSSKYSERFKNVFAQKFKNPQGKDQRNDDMNSKFSESPVKQYVRQKQRQTSNQKNIFEKYRQQFGNEKQKTGKNPVLEEKIKQAKQKAEDVLNKYMKIKKYSSKNSSKFGM